MRQVVEGNAQHEVVVVVMVDKHETLRGSEAFVLVVEEECENQNLEHDDEHVEGNDEVVQMAVTFEAVENNEGV